MRKKTAANLLCSLSMMQLQFSSARERSKTMCGRYYINDSAFRELGNLVRETDEAALLEYARDIRPSETAPVITGRSGDLNINGKMGNLKIERMIWGFPQKNGGKLLINARAETVLERSMFRDSVLHRRCIIPARGFYEWDAGKNKASFFDEHRPILYMAGFYNLFQGQDHFIIITTAANHSVRPVHDRMPLILEEHELRDWIWNNQFLESALRKTPPLLHREQEYEQQRLRLL